MKTPNWVWELYRQDKIKSIYEVLEDDFLDHQTIDLMRVQLIGEYLEKL